VRRAGKRGIDIRVGAVGLLQISDVRVTFVKGPVESIHVADILYTGGALHVEFI
jgi:hypothetical protein